MESKIIKYIFDDFQDAWDNRTNVINDTKQKGITVISKLYVTNMKRYLNVFTLIKNDSNSKSK